MAILKVKSGIKINPANKGKFTATKKATGKSTEELTHSKNSITKKRAIFAKNAKKWKHKLGGLLKRKPSSGITPDKAKQILVDGTINGKPITDKQRKYFGMLSNK